MKGVVKTLKPFYVWAFLLVGSISGIFVYAATIDTTIYTPEELVIIPSEVSSDSWQGLEYVLSQDVHKDSLWQDFSTKNSAFLPEANTTETENSTTSNSATDDSDEPHSEPVEQSDDADQNAGEINEPAPASSEAEVEPEPESTPEPEQESEPEPEPEPTAQNTNGEGFVHTVLATIIQAFPFAQQTVEEVPSNPEPTPEPESIVTEEEPSAEPDEVTTDETQPESPEVDVVPEESEAPPATAPEPDPVHIDDITPTPEESLPDFVLTPCEAALGCERHSMTFTGFTTPDFETVTTLDSVQLRLSLGAKERADHLTDPQRFVVEYTYASGTAWEVASVLDIDDELTNSINGDYFLTSLALPANFAELANLQVRVSYEGDRTGLEGIFVESVWLEVNAGSFYETGEKEEELDTLNYDRELLAPHLHELDSPDLDPALSTLPSFTLSYDPQQNFFRRIFNSLFSENTYVVDHITLADSAGNVIDVPFDITYREDTTWTLSMLKQPQKLKPGKYTVTVEVLENETPYIDTFEFYWGVLAVNPKKSMYFPNEEVEIHMAALTDTGDTICDADLTLTIIDPKNNVFEVPIEHSSECGANNVTDIPDYTAHFATTGEWGQYTMQLENRNKDGEVVHKVHDTFEVREYIPFDIERTAPTRIYPPAPYDVKLKITAYRDFKGDINERVPRGFAIDGIEGALVSTLPEYTLITWKDVEMKEGDVLNLSYQFDAPDVSPYMYLLGPLDMDGFAELRQWQIASDALSGIGWFTGTRTVAGTNINGVPSAVQWSTSSVDAYYFTHSTSSDSERVTLRQDGDYYIAVTLPQNRTDGNNSRTRVGVEVRVNGVAVPDGLGRSSLIDNQSGHAESSAHDHFLLTGIHANDYVEVYAEGIATIDVGDIVNVTGKASLYLEYIDSTANVFAATTTRTASSTNLNTTATSALQWTETRQDSDFIHSDAINPENITINNAGTYLVDINIPLTGDTTQQNITGRVRLNGVQVTGGEFKQGYLLAEVNESDANSSIHWSGIVVSTSSNQVLTVTTEREGGAGTTSVTSGFTGSIFIQTLATTSVAVFQGTNLVGGTNWNPAARAAIQWNNRPSTMDSTVYTHSTSTNSHQITINQSGDYYLSFNDAVTSALQRSNHIISVDVGSTTVSGAQTKSHYIRNQSGNNESSGALVYLLEGVTAGQVVTVYTAQEALVGTVDDTTSATLMLWKKASYNARPAAPTMYDTPFNNIRLASTTPYFEFKTNDSDGTSDIQYQFSISTTSNFAASTTRTSGVDSGFINTASSSDTSPFTEDNKIGFQLQPADALTDLYTYYWRVRAKDVTGSGGFGDWSTTQSLTVNLAATVPNWYQTYTGQFNSNTLVGAVSSGDDRVQVDSGVNTEIMIAYGDGTNSVPRYRLWTGTSWDTQQNANAVGGTINWVRTSAGVTRDEYVLLTLDQSSSTYAQVYNSTSTSWSTPVLLSNRVNNFAHKGIAVGYESLSGDAMAVSCSNGASPVYRIWNGSSWSATSSISVSSLNNCSFLEIASDPASDEMILVVRDSGATVGSNYEALVWDGSSWIANRVIGSVQAGQLDRAGIGLAYEASGQQALIAVTDGTQPRIAYTTWDGSTFSTNNTQALGNDFEFGRLVSDDDSDDMALCYVDEDTDAGVLTWNGGGWQTFQEIELTPNSNTGRPIDCTFETSAGRSDNLLINYADTVNNRYQVYSGTWPATEQTITGIEDSFWVQTERADDGTIVMVAHDDFVAGDEIESSYWNGTSWSTKQSVVPNPSSVIAAPYETYEMAAKRFQFQQGIVTSPPISFSFVANRLTWGDLSFSTTEPFGTDVKVKLKYTSTSTCDSYIPNGALPGNSTGFDVGSSTLNISGLATTTYSQICLEASITTLGAQSASLDDWSVTWLREAKLIQNNYRWYTNGSFLTPTDPWPLGVTDSPENTALAATEAVNINDVIRLRMSLQGSNVSLATSTKIFKLQYAEGQTCTPLLTWTDVGAPASTTALWRGYANSIVGSDWLSASWLRRTKITVDKTQVGEAVTAFPVYVNLDDLPDSFFANTQSDGDDIRITTSDGITELPFDLVSINTSTKVGELHFKATLSTSTNSEFYIYYGNSSASGYSASATYGSRNVWTNSYAGVYHMIQDPAGGSPPQILDSTSNARHASRTGTAGVGRVVAAQLGNGLDFVGTTGDYTIDFPSFGIGSSSSFTFSAWFLASTTVNGAAGDGAGTYMVDRTTATNELAGLKVVSGNYAHQYRYNDGTGLGALSGGAATAGSWRHVTWGRTYNSNRFITVNNVRATTTDNASLLSPPLMRLGGHQGNTSFTGLADEVRVASVARSSGWNTTEFNNQSNTIGFYAISAEELIGDGRVLPSTVLTGSDYMETYEEQNPTALNRNAIAVGNDAEWDFTLQNYGGAPDTEYCFRMVYQDGSTFNTYTQYPELITNAPPPAPTLVAPFDNEQFASTSPWFEFFTDDALSDEVSYQIEIDNNYDFGSVTIGRESNANFTEFTNLSAPSERGLYTTGNTIKFIANSALSSGTYYWRVRAKDDNGSGSYGDWSTPYSFTIASTSITTWFQTTGEQFNTDNLLDAQVSTSTNDVGILTTFTAATTTSTAIDYDDKDTGNAWGQFSFAHDVTSGSIRYYIEYNTGGNEWALIPDSALSGNSSGFTSSPVSLAGLNTVTYNEIRIMAVMLGTPSLPRLLNWKVEWGETIEVPTLVQPFDNAKANSTLPELTFNTTDPQVDDLQYEVQLSSTPSFTASSTYLSGVDAGFTNVTNGGDTSPFTSGNTIKYTIQSALTNGSTYWWRIRARDPGGTNVWSSYNDPQSFTVDTSSLTSTWFQTTGDQFATDDLTAIETPSGGAQITSVISEVMSVYGEGTGQSPQYRLWNGATWSNPESAETVDSQIRWTRLKAAPTRPEYVLGTLGTDLDINFQVYDGVTESWSNVFEIYTESVEATKRRFDLAYETTSGDLIAVACVGSNAVYSIWNGTSWSATSTISLVNTNACEWVQLTSDPTSDEIVALFRNNSASTTDFEALVWSGSSWGNSKTLGDISNNAYEGMAVNYEESGGQAVIVASNNANNSFLWSAWNGSSWTTATATAVGNDFYWASLKRDVGTDQMALCYVDADNDIGVILWNGSSWNTFSEIDQNNNDIAGRGVDCEYETISGRDGDIIIPYSDGVLTRYQTYSYASSSFSTEADLSTMNDGFYMQTVRGGDGIVHVYTLDDASNPDRYDTSRWDGSTWSTLSNFSTNPSITGTPYNGSISMAAQLSPNFTEGSIRSTPIEFSSGNSPQWERVRWNDTTPGASDIKYRVYYETATGSYALIPDSVLAGNAAGFTDSPVSIAAVDRTTYDTLKLDAELTCSSGNCPSIQDWSVEWSQGITISGSALDYDQLTAISTGTIAVAVNGVLQVGKTASLGSGTTTQQMVFDTAGTSTFTVPAGVTNVTIKAWGAGGGAGGGGASDAGGTGAGAGFVQGNFTVIPAEDLSIRIGGGGTGGSLGVPPGAGGGGGYSGVLRSSTPLAIAGGGGGGGGGTGGVQYVSAGTACAVSAAGCTPTIPAGTATNDVYIAVLHSRTNTAHTCTANCTGWTEFSTQAGSAGEGRLSVWWYRQSGAAPGNPSFGGPVTDSYSGRIWVYRGVTTSGNPYDVLGSNTAITGATTTFAGSSLNSNVADAMVVHVAGTMDNNTWGPGSGSCTIPNSVNANFYTANLNGNDNSISLCYKEYPLAAAGNLGTPINTQVANSPDVGRYFTFALKPNASGIMAAGSGGVGGGLSGTAGGNASTTTGGGGGTQSAGGSAGGGSATIGSAYTGGAGNSGTGGGAGGAGGTNGGGAGGTGNLGTLAAAGAGGGAGYYGGGGANSASGAYIAGAGGGGGSSYLAAATATSTQSGTTTQAGNNGDGDYVAGVGVGNTSATSSNGGNGGAGRVVISWSTANVPGSWSIPNVSAFTGDVITVFMQGATGTAEAVGVTKYDGVGDISGMQLSKRHLTIGSNDAPVISNANLGLYDSADTEDVFFSVTGSDVLNLCVEGTCGDARLRILASSTYQPGANGAVINFQNNGTFAPATNTLRVSGAWQQMATFTPDTSTIIFTATTSSTTLQNATTSYVFHNVTFGETSGTATWNLTKPLDITGTLGIDYGTLARGTSTINLEQNLRISNGGFITGLATTTFDGSGSNTWTDTTASTTNVGRVVIDGTAKTITLGGNVAAETVTIGADDTLNASGSGFNINVYSTWINNNAFIPQAGTVTFVGTSSNTIVRGTSAFNNLTFSGVGGVWSFSSSTLVLNGSLTIATGTVTLPTGTTTIGGSFLNTGGTFAHNNGEVRMTSSAAGRSITQRAGTFLNAFYDLVFSGSGSWSYTESAATTTRNMNILSGTVTLASSTLTVGGDFAVSGTGAFVHNNGELILLVSNSNTLRTNGSSLNNLRTRGGSGSWYNASWTARKPIVINSSQVAESLTDFPVFVDMANLGSDFFSTVKSDGGDIRVTTSDGVTEVPIEVVAINTGGQSGELHFKAPSLSTSSNSTFYVYYGNSTASGYASSTTYGARNVWTNNYAAVYHLNQDPTGSGAIMLDSTVNARHGTRSGTAAVGRLVAAKVGNGLNMVGTAGDYAIDFPSPGIGSTASYTFSAWFKSATISNGLNNDGAGTYMFDRTTATNDLAGIKIIGGNYAHQFRYGDSSGIGSVDGAAASSTGWQNVVWGRSYNSNRFIYVDKVGVTTGDSATALTPPAPRLGGHQSNTIYDGIADEFRISSVARTSGWISTEYNNQASTSAFYSVSAAQARFARTFSDTNATVLGNFILETGGDATFPSGTLSVGGSFDNDATFAANSGTVRFNSTAGAETIAVGTSSSFATLEFNSSGGDFTVTENATATVAINLTLASQFTLQSGRVLSTLGSFTNAASGSSTTWTGSVLVIANGSSSTPLNAKAHGGDVYGTLRAASSTTVKMWNSSATTYETVGTSSAIYSQDHAAVDGSLYVFGNYLRTTGTEYWTYATDFDGTALTASTSRQVNVRVSTSSTLGFVGGTLNMSGTSSASTTVDAQSGSYAISATNTSIVAQYFTMAGSDAGGLRLNASTTLSTFQDGFFTVIPGRTGITISSTTINTNPSAQYFRIGFATTSAGAASNVTLNGSSSNFVWFRTGTGNLYGEAYDANDGNPGSIRFDDSSNSITVSGTVYSDDGITTQGTSTCNGTTPNVRLVVDGGTYTASTSCNSGTGAYTFNNVTYTGDPKILVYLNTNGGVLGSAITKTPTANITNMNIYANRVITRHQDVLPLTISDMTAYDYDNDTDISFTAATGSPNTLVLRPNTELFVFASTTFAPGGNLTLQGNANSNSYEGTLQLGASSTFTAAGTETHTLAGRLVARPSSLLTAASSTFVFNATTSGKSITASSSLTFNQLQFNGVGGGWNITSPIIVGQSMAVTAGAVSGTSDITIQNGSLSGNGTLSLGSGTTTIERTNTLGGTTAWTFYNLKLGNGSVVGTTTPAGTATTTILGQLTINNAHFLRGNSSLWNLNGSGTVFVETGNFLEDTTLVRYSGANANILATTYYDLRLDAAAGSSTYTGTGSGISILRDLTVGGTASTTANFTTSDPILTVTRDVLVNSGSTLIGSDSASFSIAGSYDNNGTFVGSGGTVTFTGSSSQTIAAGASSFSSVTINGTGSFTVNENATATNAFTLTNHSNFTVSTSTTLSVGGQFTNSLGGAATTWSGSTLSLYGSGSITINASTTNDVYGTLSVGTGRRVRMWNSSASTYTALGGIYSQDHGGTDGLLHIYGTFTETSANDYWSYSTDFDGTPLTGGSARAVSVRAASGTAISYNGGSLSVVGTTSASTTIQNQASGTYSFAIGATASTTWNRVVLRDTNSSGIIFSGTPNVNDFSYTDHLVSINNASAITVGGTVIDANQAKNFTNNNFDFGGGVTGAVNVTATGTSVSSWRFTNHTGNLDGEAFDVDPGGDPGYIVWADSAALITISGNVYSDEGSTVSTVCDGSTNDIVLRVAGLTTYTAFCNATSGAYTIPSVSFSPNDTLTLYIDGKTQKAATVTVDPVSTISNMHLYENRVIVRTEGTDPISILDMSVWDSSDDADIPFTAIDSSPDTLSLPADRKLLIWNGKTFAPGGNMTLSGGGAGAAYDGTLEAQTNAVFRAVGTEAHSIGGSIIFGTGAVFTAGQSTTTFTTSGAARTVDVNSNNFYNAAFTGSGSWTITDTTTTFANNFAQSNGTITFGTGTTTVGRSFNATGGAFTINGSPLNFISTTTGNIVRFDDSPVAELRFGGTGGSWSMTDTNATTTHSFTLASGTVSLPSGNFGIGKNFRNTGGTITHNTADVIMTATTTALLRASSSDLYAVRFTGAGPFTMEDVNITLLDTLAISSGTVTFATGTLSVGGSLTVTSGGFNHASGTVLFNASAVGKTVSPSTSSFYNVQVSAPSGGYTFSAATTTNNFTLASANTFVLQSGATLAVGGVFTNSVGGAATTFTGSTVSLTSATNYSINSRTTTGDTYGTLRIGADTDIRLWNSSSATTTVATSGSLYSQDNGNVNGALYIYGDFGISTTTEYWNYAIDFDGTSLTGTERQVTVYMAQNATTTLSGGTLQILGNTGSTTNIRNQATGTYAFSVTGGTLNANYYSFDDLNAIGLSLSGTPTITELSNGYFDLSVATGSLITLSSTTLNANASKIFTNVGFNATNPLTGYNVNLSGSTINAWRFSASYGNFDGEAFDVDGVDACGSIRFDDSSCLLTEQTHARWRYDNGTEGAPNSEWFNSSWDYRKRVRFVNTTSESAATTAVKMTVTYDSDMQTDFEDLRFTGSDGITPLSYWIEKVTPSTDAVVWVKIPSLPADDTATVFMYYGTSTAPSNSSGTSTFNVFDDFEDNNITEYSGDTSLFQTDTSPVYGGTYALEAANTSGRTTDGIYRTAMTASQGEVIRWMQYINTSTGSGDEACTLFGIQSPGANNNNYAVCLEQFGVDRITLAKNVVDNDISGTVLATTTVTYATGWYEVEVDWKTNNTIKAYLYNSAGTLVGSTTATDSSYTTGGLGFTFWFQHGSWDSYTSRARGGGRPTVYFGAEQTDGGATWASALDTAGSAFQPGEKARLRIAVENSGLSITNQQFQLEYAAKGAAPSCESVATANFAAVPNQASCGSSAVCMATSSYLADGDASTDLLFDTSGTFTPGKLVESPSSKTTAFDVNQNYYTELEYVITPTVNASDALCFRVSNNGTALDFYGSVAELGLRFDPVLGSMTLNGGSSIVLTPGTTTLVYATGTVTDFNGYTDLTRATTTFYRSGVGAACSANTNSCYISTTATSSCSFQGCSGNSCTLSCVAHVYYNADPTDIETYVGQEWLAFVEVEDVSAGYDFTTTPGVELMTLRALDVNSSINYGSLQNNQDTGSTNSTSTVSNLGNDSLDVNIEATDLTSGVSYIPASQEKFATSTFTYSSCTTCTTLSSSSLTNVPLDLPKPTVPTPLTTDDLFWGIYVPLGALPTAHQGVNTFYAIGD